MGIVLLSVCNLNGIRYRYIDHTAKNDDPSVISQTASNKDLVFFDDADLYLTKEIIEAVKNTKRILIDMKDILRLNTEYRDCDVLYTSNELGLEVYR